LVGVQVGSQVWQASSYQKTWAAYHNFERNYPKLPLGDKELIFSNDLIYQNLLAFYAIEHQRNWEVDFSYQAKPYSFLFLDKKSKIDSTFLQYYEKIQENEEVLVFKIKK